MGDRLRQYRIGDFIEFQTGSSLNIKYCIDLVQIKCDMDRSHRPKWEWITLRLSFEDRYPERELRGIDSLRILGDVQIVSLYANGKQIGKRESFGMVDTRPKKNDKDLSKKATVGRKRKRPLEWMDLGWT